MSARRPPAMEPPTLSTVPALLPLDEVSTIHPQCDGNGDLVRFHGMIQDMFDPEFYLETFEAKDRVTGKTRIATGKYRDSADVLESETVDYNSPLLKSAERHSLRVIGVPALNRWTRDRRAPPERFRAPDNDEEARRSAANVPLPDGLYRAVLVKVYDNVDERLKLNDTVEVVGYLSADSQALAPTVHAVVVRKLPHCNPLLHCFCGNKELESYPNETRLRLRKVLVEILLGDALAADYVICHLISRIYVRRDVVALGNFPLNLIGAPAGYAVKFYDIIEKLVAKSHLLPLTVDNLNRAAFVPVKDYDLGRLTSGLLQLSENTHLVLDETQMTPGLLDATGLQNLSALDKAMREQRVDYDFRFYRMEYECDVPFLILSEGQSLLKADFALPLVAETSLSEIADHIFEAARHYLNDATCDEIRAYLTRAQFGEYRIVDEPQFVQEDFVAMRNEEEATEDDLHRLLVLTRLVCLSRGLSVLDRDCWNAAKDMEKERKSRLSAKKTEI